MPGAWCLVPGAYRLRDGIAAESDLRILDEYRRSFREAYEAVVAAVHVAVGLDGTGRPAKTTGAITDKLRRQRIRLSQIQDIAGLRVIVTDIFAQDSVVATLARRFPEASIDDRRTKPSFGYRAVHVVVRAENRLVEIQVRTPEQHLWAELSEKLSDVVDPSIKYGGGPISTRETLLEHSAKLALIENSERKNQEWEAAQLEDEAELRSMHPNETGYDEFALSVAKTRKLTEEHRSLMLDYKDVMRRLLLEYYNQL